MELDDLKQAWQALDRRLEREAERRHAFDFAQYRDRKVASARRWMLPVKLGLALRMVCGVALVVAAATYASARLGLPHLVASGLLLQAYGLLLVGSAAWEMQLATEIDYAEPVLAIQRRLAKLQAWRVRLVPVWMATGCFVWIPATLVVFEAAWGADVYRHAPQVVGWLVVSGAVAVLAFWVVGRRVPGAAALLNDSSVGSPIGRARRVLHEIARFEAEA